VAPNLRRVGIDISFARDTGRKRDRRITLSTARVGDRPSEPSEPSEAEEIRGFGADGTRTQNGGAGGAAQPTVRKNTRKTAIADGADAKIPVLSNDRDGEFEERAAIREFDGGYSRPEAERLARADINAPRERPRT
jgi:hypothetical protein